ncbi:MAG: glycosyltransferase [Muribaculaceae bacterium]|nr:glycosyltransferase [Muribaculaceae bacterium]
MKRILFYSENFCGEHIKGGLEVATFRIAQALKMSGQWEVYNAFRSKSDGSDKSIYTDVIKLSTSDSLFQRSLKDFIIANEIDVVVNMSRFFRHEVIRKAVMDSGREVKIIFMQHFAPGSEFKKGTFSAGYHLLRLNPFNPLYLLRATIYPLLKYSRNRRLAGVYGSTYENSDKVVLLSQGYREDYCQIGGFKDEANKITAIPNIFDAPKKDGILDGKKKRVLMLSRMDEIQKRMSVALEVWKKIEEKGTFNDWQLDIVGSGHNTDIVKRLIKKLGLRQVKYHGWKDPKPFLEQSSILMTTSEYEGLPLAILEAQAYGCVPVAFDSYASLRDVVSHNETGIIVEKFGDTDTYSNELARLMENEEWRRSLAIKGIEGADRFSSQKIGARWLKMLDEL